MDFEIQKAIITLMIGTFLSHSFLIFLESLKVSQSQYDDLLEINLKNLAVEIKFYDLLNRLQFDSNKNNHTTHSVIKAFWGLKLLRILGFVPFILFFFTGIIALFQNIFISQLDFGNLCLILVGLIFVIEVIFVSIKMGLNIPSILMNLNPRYKDKNYLLVLFSIYPFWKNN